MKILRTLVPALAVSLLFPMIQSCKKGENDPFLSLRTRKARVAGVWKVEKLSMSQSWEESGTNTSSYPTMPEPQTYTYTNKGSEQMDLDGTKLTSSSTSESMGSYNTSFNIVTDGTTDMTIEFKKDGTFLIKQQSAKTSTYTESYGFETMTNTMSDTETIEQSGTWNFLGGMEQDYKNKERIILNHLKWVSARTITNEGRKETDNNTETFGYGQFSEIWQLKGLRNKEMEITADYQGTGTFQSSFSQELVSSVSNGTSNRTGKRSATFVQE